VGPRRGCHLRKEGCERRHVVVMEEDNNRNDKDKKPTGAQCRDSRAGRSLAE